MIGHWIKNDFCYFRLWLPAWAALLLTPVLLFAGLRTELGWSPDYWRTLRIILILWFLSQFLFQAVMLATLVQKESPAVARAYWRTRPISRFQLPVAKLVWAVGLVLLPQLAQGALLGWIFPGGSAAILGGAAALGLLGAACLLLVLPAAALTRNAGTALLVCIAVPAGVALLDAFLLGRIRLAVQTFLQDLMPPTISVAGPLFALLVVCLAFGFFKRYRTDLPPRRRWRGFAAALVPLCLLVNLPPGPKPLPEATMTMPAEAELRVQSIYYQLTNPTPGGGRATDLSDKSELWRSAGSRAEYGLTGVPSWKGLPDAWLAVAEPVRSYGPDGSELEIDRSKYETISAYNLGESYKRSLFSRYDPEKNNGSAPRRVSLSSSRRLDVDALEWPAKFATLFATTVYRPKKTPLPLAEGARWALGDRRVIVDRIQADGGELRLGLVSIGRVAPDRGITTGAGGLYAIQDPETGAVAFGHQKRRNTLHVHELLAISSTEIEFQRLPIASDELSRLRLYFVEHRPVGVDLQRVDYRVAEKE